MEKFVISRETWLRGESDSESALLRESDCKMCCLGFYLKDKGLTDDEIRGVACPSDVRVDKTLPEWLLKKNPSGKTVDSDLCASLMEINDFQFDDDSPEYISTEGIFTDDVGREEVLKKLFAKAGVEVEFVD